ncbi:hypothetical protein KXJ74_08855 [Acinetobacter johnsonii]|nr:hypothetical protein KXJ74_08855 [Acinetobacter johnsonii]
MANEKNNNLRILQSTQKKPLHPVVYAVCGFFAGMALIGAIGLMFINFNNKANDALISQENFQQEEPITQHHPSISSPSHKLAQENPHSDEEEANQTYDGDLLNAFKHEKPAVQHRSPFAQAEIHPPKAAKTVQKVKPAIKSNVLPVVKSKLAVKAPPPEKNTPAPAKQTVASDPGIPSPRGSLQMTVTKTLSPVKEQAAAQ